MFRRFMIVLMLLTAGVLPLLSQTTSDGDHIVSARDLQQAMRASGQARQDNLAKIDRFSPRTLPEKHSRPSSWIPRKLRTP